MASSNLMSENPHRSIPAVMSVPSRMDMSNDGRTERGTKSL